MSLKFMKQLFVFGALALGAASQANAAACGPTRVTVPATGLIKAQEEIVIYTKTYNCSAYLTGSVEKPIGSSSVPFNQQLDIQEQRGGSWVSVSKGLNVSYQMKSTGGTYKMILRNTSTGGNPSSAGENWSISYKTPLNN